VIHAVGPIYHGGEKGEAELLASAYLNSLKRATENSIRSISFPSLSTGAYGYPFDQAAPVALKTIVEYLKVHEEINIVRFVLFGAMAFQAYEAALLSGEVLVLNNLLANSKKVVYQPVKHQS